ncbi:MAG: YcgN family cysteine cluster protein [Maritimibacter sp.]
MAKALRHKFWERPLGELSAPEWEALCDGCGKCCLNKLEDEDTGQVVFTSVACRLLDDQTCRCAQYDIRLQFVPECIVLKPSNMDDIGYFMPATCAYRLRHEGKPLPEWHPLKTNDPESVHRAEQSVRGWTTPEFEVDEEEWENYVIEEPH